LNSHDGTTAYQLRVGLFRAVCTNGLIASLAAFPVWRVPHRGDILDGVVKAALEVSETFAELGDQVEQMEWKLLTEDQRLDFAHEALLLRFPELPHGGLSPPQLLQIRRPEDLPAHRSVAQPRDRRGVSLRISRWGDPQEELGR